MNKSIIGIVIGIIVLVIGIILAESMPNVPYILADIGVNPAYEHNSKLRENYHLIANFGAFIIMLFTLVLFYQAFMKYLMPSVSKKLAEKELLKNKELFDKGILTQQEYDTKMTKLKEKIID